MQPILKMIREIRDGLAGRATVASWDGLAAEYARLCQEGNQRLESCAAMLEKGSEYQALQLAETEPSLLDLLAVLSFAEAPDWVRLCEAQQLPVPPRFDGRAIQALDRLYAKGIGSNHPLYKDYRSAVTSRDDVRALQIIRSIARLNPGDANARSEQERWEGKFFQKKLQDLKSALAGGGEELALRELAEIERLASPEKLAELPEYGRASAIRREFERNDAAALAERLVRSLQDERLAGAWRMVGEILTRVSRLQSDHGFRLKPEEAAICAEMQRYFEEAQAAAAQTARFQEAVHIVDSMTHQLETRLLARSTLMLQECESLYLEFNRRWKDVEQFRKAAPEQLIQRVRTVAATLHAEINRLQRTRRNKIVAGLAGILIVIGIGQWFAVRAFRVHDYAKQLAGLKESGQVEAAEKMVAHVRADLPALASRPSLRARLDEVEEWTRAQRVKYTDADARLAELEKAAQGDFGEADPSTLGSDYALAGQLVDNLPAGLKSAQADRLTVVGNKLEIHLAGVREKLTTQAEEDLAALENLAGSKLGFDQPQEVIAETLEKGDPGIKSLESRVQPKVEALALPVDQRRRVQTLRKRFDLFTTELDTLRRSNEALLRAATLGEFQRALEEFKRSQLNEAVEVKAARKLLARFPKPDEVLAELLMPGDPVGWAAAKADASGESFLPDSVLSAELSRLLSLRDDSYISDIWEATMITKTGRRESKTVYSRGEIVEKTGDESAEWTGSFYVPGPGTTEAVGFYPKATLRTAANSSGSVLKDIRRTSASRCLVNLELNRMTNADGTKYERPLLGAFDAVVRDKDAPPVFKAFVMQQLMLILNLRPNAWGLEFCPSLRGDLASLARICGDEKILGQDWLLERKREQWNGRLGPFFNELKSRNYLTEARVQREMVRAALRAGLQFGGFIDGQGRVHLLGEASNGALLWATLAEGSRIARLPIQGVNAGADASFARFSPILFVPIDRDAVIADVKQKVGGPDAAKSKLPVAPFFNP